MTVPPTMKPTTLAQLERRNAVIAGSIRVGAKRLRSILATSRELAETGSPAAAPLEFVLVEEWAALLAALDAVVGEEGR